MSDIYLGQTMTKKYRLIAGATAYTISDVGFLPDHIVVTRIDSAFGTAANISRSEFYRDMTNADALQFRSVADNGVTGNTSLVFETTNGITITTNAAGVTTSRSAVGAITGATAANPVVITDAAHGLSDGDIIRITGVVGMVELNNRRFRVADSATNTFSLQDPETREAIDGTNYTAYTSGGQWNLLSREDADRDVYDAVTYDVTLGTAVLTNDIEHVVEMFKAGSVEDLGDIG